MKTSTLTRKFEILKIYYNIIMYVNIKILEKTTSQFSSKS